MLPRRTLPSLTLAPDGSESMLSVNGAGATAAGALGAWLSLLAAPAGTCERLCAHHGGPGWRDDKDIHVTFYHVRGELVPVMGQAGMDPRTVEMLCSWAEKAVLHR